MDCTLFKNAAEPDFFFFAFLNRVCSVAGREQKHTYLFYLLSDSSSRCGALTQRGRSHFLSPNKTPRKMPHLLSLSFSFLSFFSSLSSLSPRPHPRCSSPTRVGKLGGAQAGGRTAARPRGTTGPFALHFLPRHCAPHGLCRGGITVQRLTSLLTLLEYDDGCFMTGISKRPLICLSLPTLSLSPSRLSSSSLLSPLSSPLSSPLECENQ